ncbi:MAG: nucleotidyltransferase domain-containing protein [Prevotella sp.]|nr:nucleotidyltransferase domain-containing protein [Prevotella sp.]
MINEEIREKISLAQDYFESQPIKKAWIFGSCSRGEENEDSDVDILVKYENVETLSLFEVIEIQLDLQKIFNRPIDLVEDGCLLPFAEKSANLDRILIYERGKKVF